MPVHCVVPGCPSSEWTNKRLAFFGLPENLEKRVQWLRLCRLEDSQISNRARICELHFRKDFIIESSRRKMLTQDAMPEIHHQPVTHSINIKYNSETPTMYQVLFSNGFVLQVQITITNQPVPTLVCLSAETKPVFEADNQPISLKRKRDLVGEVGLDRNALKKPKSIPLVNFTKTNPLVAKRRPKLNLLQLREKRAIATAKLEGEQSVISKLKVLFTPNQIKAILTGRKSKYTSTEIASAIALRYKSNPYRELLARNFPLPSERTIQRYLKDIDFEPGLQHSVLEVLQSSLKGQSRLMKQVVIGMDEMAMSSKYELENSTGKIIGGASNLHVIVLRGLFYSWKQIIYYDFDKKFTKEEFEDIIAQVERHGFDVRAIVTDLGSTNTSLRKKLGISVDFRNGALKIQNVFKSPTKSNSIYFFADIPHMIKLLRNHVLNDGLVIPGEDSKSFVLKKSFFEDLLKKENQSELKACWKLSSAHLNLSQLDKMRVKYAAHLFSASVAKYAAYAFPEDTIPADFIESISNGFDSLNARHLNDPEPLKKPYGLALNLQSQSLDKLFKAILNCRVVGSKTLLPFQKGILLSIASFKQLFNELKDSSLGIEYVFGSHLTTDCVENLFSQVRSFGGNNTNPTATETKRRLKLLMLAKCESISRSTNVIADGMPNCLSSNLLEELRKHQKNLTEPEPTLNENDLMENMDSIGDSLNDITHGEAESSINFGLEYIAGAVASKCCIKNPYLNASDDEVEAVKSTSWIQQLKKEHLHIPSNAWLVQAKLLDHEFENYFGSLKNPKKDMSLTLFLKAMIKKYCHIPSEVITKFARMRTGVRIRSLNQILQSRNSFLKTLKSTREQNLRQAVRDHIEISQENSQLETTAISVNDNVFLGKFPWDDKVNAAAQLLIANKLLRNTQRLAINACLSGVDVAVISPTGSGKSLIYQIPAIVENGITLVVSPLLAIIQDQMEKLKNLNVCALDVSTPYENAVMKEKLKDAKLVYTTPEKLKTSDQLNSVLAEFHGKGYFSRLVIDEAHCISQWGKTFRKSYQFLGEFRQQYSDVPVLFLSATMNNQMITEAQHNLGLQSLSLFVDNSLRVNLRLETCFSEKSEKNNLILAAVKNDLLGETGIIYCGLIAECDKLYLMLKKNGIRAMAYHGNLKEATRKLVLDAWMKQEIDIVVATTALGMGISNDNCSFVLHATPPQSLLEYCQQIGRAGRKGQLSKCKVFYSLDDGINLIKLGCLDRRQYSYSMDVLKYLLNTTVCRSSYVLSSFTGYSEVDGRNCECENCTSNLKVSENILPVVKSFISILNSDSEKTQTAIKLINGVLSLANQPLKGSNIVGPRLSYEKLLLFCLAEGFLGVQFDYQLYKTVVKITPGVKTINNLTSILYQF